MNICYVGKFKKVTATERIIANALIKSNHNVFQLDYTKQNANQQLKRSSNYDLFIFSKSETIDNNIIASIKEKKVFWIFDGLYTTSHNNIRKDAVWLEKAKLMDFVLTAAPGDVDFYKSIGCNAIFLPQACDQKTYFDMNKKKSIDIVFIGRKYGSYRIKILREIFKKYPQLRIYSESDWEELPTNKAVFWKQAAAVYNSSRIVLAMGEIEQHIDQWSNRIWNALGCNTVILTKFSQSLTQFFKNKEHLVWWSNEEELLKELEILLKNEKMQKNISTNACKIAQKHTYEERTKQLLEIIK